MAEWSLLSTFMLGVATLLCCFAIGFPEWTVRRQYDGLRRTEHLEDKAYVVSGYMDLKDGLFQECRFFHYQPVHELVQENLTEKAKEIPSEWTYCDYYGQGPVAEPFKIACAFFMVLCLVCLMVAFVMSFCADRQRLANLNVIMAAMAPALAAGVSALIAFFTWIGVTTSRWAVGGNLGPCLWITLVVAILSLGAVPVCLLALREKKSAKAREVDTFPSNAVAF